MQTVYSRRFCSLAVTSTLQTAYTVPPGYTAVVREMTLGWGTLARVGGAFNAQMGPNNSRIWTLSLQASSQGSDHWSGYLVLPAGEVINVSTSATGTIWFTASGYLLLLP